MAMPRGSREDRRAAPRKSENLFAFAMNFRTIRSGLLKRAIQKYILDPFSLDILKEVK